MKTVLFTLMACAISISAFSQYSTLSVSQDPGSDATQALTPIYMVKLQTKKIEKLTLYLIEKDKEINDLNSTQQSQIDDLRKQVETLLKRKP